MHSPDGMLALGWRGLGPTLLRVRSRRVSGLRARAALRWDGPASPEGTRSLTGCYSPAV